MIKNIKILVIDDDDAVRETICENLVDSGFSVTQAADGEQGMQRIYEAGPPDIVITDIIMPRKEGLETIIAIKKAYPAIKIIAMSGGGRTKATDFLDLAKKLGAHAVMPKPVDIDELEKAIDALSS